MTDIAHIVFDIGRVLLHYDPEIPYRRLIPDDAERAWFLENVCSHDWNIEQDRGRSWREAEDLLIAEYPDHAETIRAFRANWNEMVPHAYDGSVDILRSLIATGHDVTMLTNFASDTLEEARGRFPFLTESRGVTVSAEVGLLKPDRRIYESHTTTFNLEPTATLFIDDSPANVEGAQKVGWQAVHFTDPVKLLRDLQAYGVAI